jgi:hypothetical protein
MSALLERVNASQALADLPMDTDALTCGGASAPVLTTPAAVVATAMVIAYAAGYAAGHGSPSPHPDPQ